MARLWIFVEKTETISKRALETDNNKKADVRVTFESYHSGGGKKSLYRRMSSRPTQLISQSSTSAPS